MSSLSNNIIKWSDGTEKRVFDISVSLSGKTPAFPGQPLFRKKLLYRLAKGDRSNVSELSLTSHTGTHVDSPNHFIDKMETIDKIAFKRVMGPSRVFEMKTRQKIDASDIEHLDIEPGIIALFKTRNSELLSNKEFQKDYVYFTKEAAEILRDVGVAAVGLDYFIVDEFDNTSRPVHHILLGKGIVLIEGLNLSHVPAGNYYFICLPLRIKEGDGAPARAVLVEP
jgi:arylformamidase